MKPRKRRWPAVVGVVALLAGIGVGARYGLPYLKEQAAKEQTAEQTPAPQTSTAPDKTTNPTPYARPATPGWLPAGWQRIVDDETRPAVVAGEATNGGTCQYEGAGVLRVSRDEFDVSGCNMAPEVKQNVLTSAAIEAEFAVRSGCGGMWMRTGARGYFVAVCADGTIQLHALADDPPSETTRIGGPWKPSFDKGHVVVGLVANGKDLMVVVDGVSLEIVIDESIGSGRLGVGGFAPSPDNKMDATITRLRAWTPPTGTGS